ncbi:hypothetical protein Ae201684P_019720 [Aphanomyces euteiches]|uniref:RxLR effector protein n=1 Tax=Aphanomyces euteiches TaxID=100861 RepID=A0A6G0WDI4_9STRA|nr:hypothetical protein Ae201684_016654 [Aphanomyces euteiches]KAH9078641.1 hypothetical protein Ae201684P_019720 [Aphanomyces euteiches]KAH9142479.1 hypothetical protein AeRB84_013454 [Aphanomyces euteiches]
MRVLTSLALATCAVVAFKQPRKDSPVVSAHQQASAVNDLRTLKQEVPTATHSSRARRLAATGLLTCCFKGQSRTPAIPSGRDSRSASQRRYDTQYEVPIEPQAQQRQGRTQSRPAPQRQESTSGRSSSSSSPVQQYWARLDPR